MLLSTATQKSRADTFGAGDRAFDIEFVTIGNPGNRDDTPRDGFSLGSVDYIYRIGMHEISREMVTKANAAGYLNIFLDPMNQVESDLRPDMPAVISWNGAARFVNWLNVSQGYMPAYKFAAQPGDDNYYSLDGIQLWEESDPGYDPTNLFRNRLAHYFLPSIDEWHKAAYYDANANGGNGGYWRYPTGSNSRPTAIMGGTDAGTAVYNFPDELGPADITQAGGPSPYGAIAMGGNVWEFQETALDLVNDDPGESRRFFGGDWDSTPVKMMSHAVGGWASPTFPHSGGSTVGFRVASVPEPSSLMLAVFGLTGTLLFRRCRRTI